jgi:DNA-binding transcriptional regulator PaaX
MKKTETDKNPWKPKRKKKLFGRKRIRNFTKQFLENLLYLADDFGEIAFDRKAVFCKAYGYAGGWSKLQFSKHLCDLKSRGYLTFEKDENGQSSARFTNKAKIKVLDKISQSLTEDGKNRFVSFDVPEKLKGKRDLFRNAIKQLGFKQVQKSLWVTNRNVGDLVEIAAHEFGVEQYVIYIVAEKTDIDGIIKKRFEIKSEEKN